MGKRQNFVGQNFWTRGYFFSTKRRDEATVGAYTRKQEEEAAGSVGKCYNQPLPAWVGHNNSVDQIMVFKAGFCRRLMPQEYLQYEELIS